MADDSSGTLQGSVRETVQTQLEEIVSAFEALGRRLRDVHSSLPVSPREDVMLLGEEDPDYSCIVRGAIECVLNDHLKIIAQMLLTAATSEAK